MKAPQVRIVWHTGTVHTTSPSICWAVTTFWTEVIWLKVSMVLSLWRQTPHGTAQRPYSLSWALDFGVLLPKYAAGPRVTEATSRAHRREVLTFRGFQERMLGNTGQLSRLWFTAGCSVNELSLGSWLCLEPGEAFLNNNLLLRFLFQSLLVARKTGPNPNFGCRTGVDLRSRLIHVFESKHSFRVLQNTAAPFPWLCHPNYCKVFSWPRL